MEEALHFGHHEVATILKDYHEKYSPQAGDTNTQESAEKNLDGLL